MSTREKRTGLLPALLSSYPEIREAAEGVLERACKGRTVAQAAAELGVSRAWLYRIDAERRARAGNEKEHPTND